MAINNNNNNNINRDYNNLTEECLLGPRTVGEVKEFESPS